MLASSLTKQGAELYDLLEQELELRVFPSSFLDDCSIRRNLD